MNKSTGDTSPRKIWVVYRQEPFSVNRIGWLALNQPATDTVPAGDPLAFAYKDPLNDDDDDMAKLRKQSLEEYAKQADPILLGPALVDLRHVGRIDSMFAVPAWLHGVLLEDSDEDSADRMFPYCQFCRYFFYAVREPARTMLPPIARDMNGVPIRERDLIVTDDGDIGRVRATAGSDPSESAVIYDLLYRGDIQEIQKVTCGGSWRCRQVMVMLRADGTRPEMPVRPKKKRSVK